MSRFFFWRRAGIHPTFICDDTSIWSVFRTPNADTTHVPTDAVFRASHACVSVICLSHMPCLHDDYRHRGACVGVPSALCAVRAASVQWSRAALRRVRAAGRRAADRGCRRREPLALTPPPPRPEEGPSPRGSPRFQLRQALAVSAAAPPLRVRPRAVSAPRHRCGLCSRRPRCRRTLHVGAACAGRRHTEREGPTPCSHGAAGAVCAPACNRRGPTIPGRPARPTARTDPLRTHAAPAVPT